MVVAGYAADLTRLAELDAHVCVQQQHSGACSSLPQWKTGKRAILPPSPSAFVKSAKM